MLAPKEVSICGSDLHYFTGQKSPWKLKKRLPLILLHEGVCEVIQGNKLYSQGERVLVVPLRPCGKCRPCLRGEENLCHKAHFMGSTAPGLARTALSYPAKLVLKIPPEIPSQIAAITELVTVAYRAVVESEVQKDVPLVVIGDGPLGYIVTLLLSSFKGINKEKLFFVGRSQNKLRLATDFSTPINISKQKDQETFHSLYGKIFGVFEAVGGSSMEETVDQGIELLNPGNKLVVLGLRDKEISLKMSRIVNKGIILKGSSRSRKSDYISVFELMRDSLFQARLKRIIPNRPFRISSAEDLRKAFSYAANSRSIKKTMLKFETTRKEEL